MKQGYVGKKNYHKVQSYPNWKPKGLKKSDIQGVTGKDTGLRRQQIKAKNPKAKDPKGNTVKRKPEVNKDKKENQSLQSRYVDQKKKTVADKRKSNTLKIVGTAGAKTALNEMEGGTEVYESVQIVSVLTAPLSKAGEEGRKLYKTTVVKQAAEKRIKKVNTSKKYGSSKAKDVAAKGAKDTTKKAVQDTAQKTAKDNAKKAVKETAKKVVKETAKTTAKASAQAAGTAAGTVTTGAGGVLVGAAVGERVSSQMDKWDMKTTTRNRMIQLFIANLRREENQDNIGKALKDIALMRMSILLKKVVTYVGLFLAGLFALIALVALPIIAIITVIYSSPLAILFPSISSGETTQGVLTAYVLEFNSEVDWEVGNYPGYDWCEKRYTGYGGEGAPNNYYDIIATYMVKYGIGDTATDMIDKAKSNLKKVFDDMCIYTITSGTKTVIEVIDEEEVEITYRIKYVNVTLKTYQDMIAKYRFNQEEVELLLELLKPENLALIDGNGGGGPGAAISSEQYQAIMDGISDENGKKVVAFVLSKVGYPYSQPFRDSGNYFDCSSLAYYAWRSAGVSILYEGSNTAASEGKYCYDKCYLVSYDQMQPGDLIFYSYSSNGRFMNITHVAVYVGNGMVVEAANERIGVVYRVVQSRNSIVFIGRPR